VSGAEVRAAVPRAELETIALQAVERARAAGAEHAEACVESSRSFVVRVMGGQIETLKQSVTHGLGVRVLVDGAMGFVSTTDFAGATLDDLARRAVALARFSTPDPANAMPADEGEEAPGDLELYDPGVVTLPPEARIERALELERIALAHDPRIRRTDGARVSSGDGATVLANSSGLLRSWSETSTGMVVVPLADDRDGKQQTGYRGVAKRWLADLPDLEEVAREAAARAIARIGARPVGAARVPVVFHPDVGAAWIGDLHDAFSAEAVIKKASWLTEKLGETIAAPGVTLVDDGRIPRGLGSSPWDGEGVPTRRNLLIDRGTCATFLYDTYHARRAGARSTGSAVRSYASVPGIGAHNLHLEPGTADPDAIVRGIDRGFYMDDQGSYGFNAVTGDYSYQAQGFWIEKGEKAFPVDGVTVAGNALDMLRDVAAIGNDLRFDHAVACPTLLIGELTVSGKG
jgi:PmbA protein